MIWCILLVLNIGFVENLPLLGDYEESIESAETSIDSTEELPLNFRNEPSFDKMAGLFKDFDAKCGCHNFSKDPNVTVLDVMKNFNELCDCLRTPTTTTKKSTRKATTTGRTTTKRATTTRTVPRVKSRDCPRKEHSEYEPFFCTKFYVCYCEKCYNDGKICNLPFAG